jgi:hypothetical protein
MQKQLSNFPKEVDGRDVGDVTLTDSAVVVVMCDIAENANFRMSLFIRLERSGSR